MHAARISQCRQHLKSHRLSKMKAFHRQLRWWDLGNKDDLSRRWALGEVMWPHLKSWFIGNRLKNFTPRLSNSEFIHLDSKVYTRTATDFNQISQILFGHKCLRDPWPLLTHTYRLCWEMCKSLLCGLLSITRRWGLVWQHQGKAALKSSLCVCVCACVCLYSYTCKSLEGRGKYTYTYWALGFLGGTHTELVLQKLNSVIEKVLEEHGYWNPFSHITWWLSEIPCCSTNITHPFPSQHFYQCHSASTDRFFPPSTAQGHWEASWRSPPWWKHLRFLLFSVLTLYPACSCYTSLIFLWYLSSSSVSFLTPSRLWTNLRAGTLTYSPLIPAYSHSVIFTLAFIHFFKAVCVKHWDG